MMYQSWSDKKTKILTYEEWLEKDEKQRPPTELGNDKYWGMTLGCSGFAPGFKLYWVHGVAKSWTRLSEFTFTFHFPALEKEMATHSSVLSWRIPGTGEPGELPSMGSHRVGHVWSDLAAAAWDQGNLMNLSESQLHHMKSEDKNTHQGPYGNQIKWYLQSACCSAWHWLTAWYLWVSLNGHIFISPNFWE